MAKTQAKLAKAQIKVLEAGARQPRGTMTPIPRAMNAAVLGNLREYAIWTQQPTTVPKKPVRA
jgi:hypothetical protein